MTSRSEMRISMEILRGLDLKIEKSAVSLGKFDGIHLGHRLLLDEILKHKDLVPTVFTFEAGAKERLKKGLPIPGNLIYSEKEKEIILDTMGIKRAVLFPFNEETKNMEPEDFIEKFLVEKMDAQFICVGEDYRFGKDRRGNAGMLKSFAAKFGYDIKVFHKLTLDNEIISSTLIRDKLENGDIMRANKLLGRTYFIEGGVIHGKALGRRLNMPTANIIPNQEKVLLPSGVYATTVILDGKRYPAVTNIGRKPTVGTNDIGVETCILNFNKDIYGQNIMVEFHEFLRHERKFPDIEHLQNQMEHDKVRAAEILKKYK